jgi:ubiquitin-conjugating enzyme E2 W
MAAMSAKRLQKELAKIQGTLPPGITLVSAPDLKEWQMDLRVLDNPLYDPDEHFRLRFTFSSSYPIEAPEVVFVERASEPVRRIPMHPHVYSNGIICLDLLDAQGWSPVHNVESICISLQSMLASNTKNERWCLLEDISRTASLLIVLQDLRVMPNSYAQTANDPGTSTSCITIQTCR